MSETLSFRRVAIMGAGLIGGSFALAIHREFPETVIVAFDRPEVMQHALAARIADEIAPDLPFAVRTADLIYLAMPVVSSIDALPAIAAAAGPRALVTDACSTKSVICRVAGECFKSGARFLGGHPIAGSELSGIERADASLFRHSRYALIARETDGDPRIRRFASLLRKIGAEPVWCDAAAHDAAAALVSHLPQLASIALADVIEGQPAPLEAVSDLRLSLAGAGLRDTLRLAGSPYSVWRDICLTNKQNISCALDALALALDRLREQLASKDLEERFFAANELYKSLRKLQ